MIARQKGRGGPNFPSARRCRARRACAWRRRAEARDHSEPRFGVGGAALTIEPRQPAGMRDLDDRRGVLEAKGVFVNQAGLS